MADLMASQGQFRGWDYQRKRQLLNALLNVLARFKSKGMSGYSCTVLFRAYDIAKTQDPALRKLEAICVNHCVGGVQWKAEQPEVKKIRLSLFFDRNEPFLNTINQVWRRLKKRKTG
jgi:hypothetical protein